MTQLDDAHESPSRTGRTPTIAGALGRVGSRAAFGLLSATVLAGCLLYLLIRALADGGSLGAARPWVILAALAAVAALTTWLVGERDGADARTSAERARAAEAAATADAESARADADDAREAQRRARDAERQAQEQARAADDAATTARQTAERAQAAVEKERDEARRELSEERAHHAHAVQAWRGEREWNRDLRAQIQRMQRAQGVFGRHDDVRHLVLRLTMEMVDAEKGLLLTRSQSGEDGFAVVCFEGWDNDPTDSAVARRFAAEVIAQDSTVREDDRARVDADRGSAADHEVRNLLAIPVYLADEFTGVIVCANRDGGFSELDDEVLLAIGDHAGAVLENSRLHGDLRSAYLATIAVLANAIELKDPELRGHSDHVSEYVLAVADRLRFEPERREKLIFASLLHDVGKLGISERILLKPAALTPEERSTIQLHPRIGYQLVRQVPALQDIAPAVLHHHERFDGAGYPGRLSGESIPLESRIIAVADSFSAIVSDRPYSPGRSSEDACVELERCAGGQFDPEVVRLFVEEVRRRPPAASAQEAAPVDPEVELHRQAGEFRIGQRSYAITDSLTLLYSHRHLHETARAEAARAELQGRSFTVVVAELTGLGVLNRTRGFAAGDRMLQTVADVVQRAAARHLGLAFRASGRRLALLSAELDPAATEALLAGLRLELGQVLNGDHEAAAIGLGAAEWRLGEDGESVIARATDSARVAAVA